jgi:flavin reductase (DIM6/NTAB) family NADH-FMN oxidoreductase RutF
VRRAFDPAETGAHGFYRLLTAVVVPRPIAWVSSRSADGQDNLAPHSFFTVACVDPPIVQFTSVREKDTLRNVRETGEFVVCLAPEPLFEHVNASATDFPHGVSEFDAVGVTPEPSDLVAPARVAESPVALECRLERDVDLGDSTIVLGRVVHAAIDEAVLGDDGLPDVQRLRPLARLGRNEWSTLGDVLAIDRIAHGDWPAHFRPPAGTPGTSA